MYIGINQMLKKLSPLYTAKNFTKNIKKTCRGCETCTKNKTRGQNKYGLMSHLGPATKPFEIVSIDTIGGFGGSRSTKRYLHLLVDHFKVRIYYNFKNSKRKGLCKVNEQYSRNGGH